MSTLLYRYSFALFLIFLGVTIHGGTTRVSLTQYIEQSCRNDTMFQKILIEELRLRYTETLTLPSADFLLTLNGETGITFSGIQKPSLHLSLSKLFPQKGFSLTANINSIPIQNINRNNEIDITYRVDLVKNSFGRSDRMLSHFVGMENQIIRFQIIQAYETHLVNLIDYYYTWMKNYRALLASRIFVSETKVLLANIQKRKARHIALQVEVDKAKLQVLEKEERLRKAQEEFAQTTIKIAFIMGVSVKSDLFPDTTEEYQWLTQNAEKDLTTLSFDSTRTGKMHALLYERDSIALTMARDDLLPSLSAYAGFGVAGEKGKYLDNSHIRAGFDLSFPFQNSKQRAHVAVARLKQKTTYSNTRAFLNSVYMRFAQLQALIESYKNAVTLAQKRLVVAKAVLNAESKDYRYGRSSLNDLLQALNTLQTDRLLSVYARIDLAKIRLEALDLFDQLVRETNVDTLRTYGPFQKKR